MAYSAARKQSRQFAPAVAGALREGKLDEAIKIADRYKKSHLAKVVVAGLQEFQAHQISSEIPGEEIEASKRALERAEAIVHAELKRGISGLATIGSTAPFVGLFGTVVGIINAFKAISTEKSTGLGAVAGGISEALVTTAIGLFVAIPAVWMFNYFTGKIEAFDVEMGNSSSELIDYFLKRSQRAPLRGSRAFSVQPPARFELARCSDSRVLRPAVRSAGDEDLRSSHMSIIMKHESPPPVADINVTPMVDVMLVMLIIFMVITPMLTKGVSVDMVKTKNPIAMQAADKTDAIIVAVTRDGKTFLGNTQMPADQMAPKVKDLLTNRLDKDGVSAGRFAGPVREGGGRGEQSAGRRRGSTWTADRADPGEEAAAGCSSSAASGPIRRECSVRLRGAILCQWQ